MAEHPVDAGRCLVAGNRTRAKAEPLSAHGAEVVVSAEGLAVRIEVVPTSLADGEAFEDEAADIVAGRTYVGGAGRRERRHDAYPPGLVAAVAASAPSYRQRPRDGRHGHA